MLKHWSDLPDILTVSDVAEFLKVDESTVYKKAKSGEFPRLNMSAVRFDRDTLRSYLTGSLKIEGNRDFSDVGPTKRKVKLCL